MADSVAAPFRLPRLLHAAALFLSRPAGVLSALGVFALAAALYTLLLWSAPAVKVHEGVVMFSSLGRAERALLPDDAGDIHHAWWARGRSYCSVTRFAVGDAAAYCRAHDFRPLSAAPALDTLPQELAQLPWFRPLGQLNGGASAEESAYSARIYADEKGEFFYLWVRE